MALRNGAVVPLLNVTRSDDEVIVIAPPNAHVNARAKLRWFTTVEAFEEWRNGSLKAPPLHAAVLEALHQLGFGMPPAALAGLFAWLGSQQRVPHLKELARQCSSRRTFFRAWRGEMPESPAQFLLRVRRIRATALLSTGHHYRDAAIAAGFSSIEAMRQKLARGTALASV